MSLAMLVSGIGLALGTIREHKMRSFLTVLGVIIGTGTVIAVGSIIAGLDGAIANAIRGFGPNTLIVFKFKIGVNFHMTSEELNRKPLTYENARVVAERCPSVNHVSPYLFPTGGGIPRVRYQGNDVYQVQIGGTEEGYAAGGTTMKFGRFFTDVENSHHLPVAVIGEDVQKALFPNADPTGKVVELSGHHVQVVGVMERPAESLPGQDDLRVLLPYFTMHKMFPNAKEHMLVVIAKEGKLPAAMDEVTAVLRQERHVPFSKPDNFSISTAEQMLDDFRKMMSMTVIVMVVLSSIGLLVGGIGVMNIMLVSVTERTREIGIRKAIGARSSDIILQFLTEAVVLTLTGGMIGMVFGWAISLASHLLYANLPTAVPLWAVGLGVAVSVGVGLFFGIWPASKAARLDPVVALRYE